jgi:hypothetical protein
MPISILATIGCSLLSFGAGYFGFKIRTKWCPKHGVPLKCPECSTTARRRPQAVGW